MTRFTLMALLALAPACLVKDLELDTDGEASSGATGASSDGVQDPSSSETGDTPAAPTTIDDPDSWAAMMATRRCEAFERCGCFTEEWSWFDPEACFEDNYEFYWQRAEWAQSQGALLNPACADLHAETLFDGACDETVPPLAGDSLYGSIACHMFVGGAALGEACATRVDIFLVDDTCQDGLHCTPAGCALPLEEGEACAAGTSYCADGLVCTQGVCTALGQLGSSCSEGSCAPGLTCAQNECIVAAGPGAQCQFGFECASLRCVDARCDAPAAALCGPYAWEVPE